MKLLSALGKCGVRLYFQFVLNLKLAKEKLLLVFMTISVRFKHLRPFSGVQNSEIIRNFLCMFVEGIVRSREADNC